MKELFICFLFILCLYLQEGLEQHEILTKCKQDNATIYEQNVCTYLLSNN